MKNILCCILIFISLLFFSCTLSKKGTAVIEKTLYGKLADGREVYQYTLKNNSGATMKIIDYGAIVTSLLVPDRNGKFEDVVTGYDSLEGYVKDRSFFGAIVGRYGNRIGKGKFKLDGHEYQLTVNDGENHLHGGKIGFFKVLWNANVVNDSSGPSIEMTYVSPDGEEGYPGTVTMSIIFTLTEKNELRIVYKGTTDKPTILNPTHHSYFNLSGSFNKTILDHLLMIDADFMTPVDKGLIPTGKLMGVAKTPFDFHQLTAIGARINDSNEQLIFGKGYDHNWVIKGFDGTVRKIAELYEPTSGRLMSILSNQPGLQFYSGNFMDGTIKAKGVTYQHRTALCLETQGFPDSPNKPEFPSVTLRPGEVYHQTTIYQFSTK